MGVATFLESPSNIGKKSWCASFVDGSFEDVMGSPSQFDEFSMGRVIPHVDPFVYQGRS